MTVIEHDFGSAKRLSARRFTKLLELDALHEANIRANPLPYIERASERIFRLRQLLFEALQSAQPQASEGDETITVSKAEYLRLKNCLALLERGFELYGQEDESV
ncbi:MAG TPA: hypothetical protein VED87_11065 [Methylocystis sp.]|nr:hypothetical protein [Methylocystis sp.]